MTKKKDKFYFDTQQKKFDHKQRRAISFIRKYPRIKQELAQGLEVSDIDAAMYDIITAVILNTKFLPNGYDRLDLIAGKYWQDDKITAKSIAREKAVDRKTAMNWLYDFVNAVAESI